ncbi:MAG: beta-ketoacyl-ACP synthase I, partial [Thermoanaerobaculia bacterium]|nr:beta-ketoacyl-ACP synthase I [Thermoanaerobaculia bacterium]
MSRAVVVTGIGIISALGRGTDATLSAIRNSRSGIRHLRDLTPTDEVRESWIGGQVESDSIEDSRHDRFVRL